MATENISRLAGENGFHMKKYEIGLLKNNLTSQLSHLLEEKEVFSSEIERLNDAIRQSKEDRTFLIQSLTQSPYSDGEQRSHSTPLTKRDEYSERRSQGSPTIYKKSIRVLNKEKDEDYIERRGRKPKSLRVSIPISDVQLPKAAIDNMPQKKNCDKRSCKNPPNNFIIKQKDNSLQNIALSAHTSNVLGILKDNSENKSFHEADGKSVHGKHYSPKSIGKDLPINNVEKDLPINNVGNNLNVYQNGAGVSPVETSTKSYPKFTSDSELFKEFEESRNNSSDI